MPGLVEQIEQKPEYLILGAVGVGVALFMLANKGQSNQLPKASGPTQVTTTPASDTLSLGVLDNQMRTYQQSEQAWILQTLEQYYSTYNGQPPNQAPAPPVLPSLQCSPGFHLDNNGYCVPDGGQGGGEGSQGAQLPMFGFAGGGKGRGGDGPGAPALTGRRFNSFGIRSLESGW